MAWTKAAQQASLKVKRAKAKLRGIDYSKITEGDNCCWIYNSYNIGVGYRGVEYQGRSVVAHRVMWIQFYGPIPNGLWVLHACDVKSCVNPFHLFLGTVADNNRDRTIKGRSHRPFGNQWNVGKKQPHSVCLKRSLALKGKPWSAARRAAFMK